MRRLSNEDRGASMVFIAICLVFLIGFAGLAVDVGALYAEKTELQKGAEAAVLAIAEDCGHGTKPCDIPTASTTAKDYIDANATDLAGAVDSVDLDTVGQTVAVIDQTERSDGGSIFLPFFAQVVGFGGTTVRARASAAWGAPSGMGTFPLIISDCEWRNYGDDPGSWPSEPDFDTPPILFIFQTGNGPDGPPECNAVAGQDADADGKLDGNFGSLETTDCEAETTIGSWAEGDSGASLEDQCDASHLESLIGKVIFVPWFNDDDGATGGGSSAAYLVGGYSPFYLTGYDLGGQLKHNSIVSGKKVDCGPFGGKCIEGYLVKATATDGVLGGEYRGVLVVKLTG